MPKIVFVWKGSLQRPGREVLEKGVKTTIEKVFADCVNIREIKVTALGPCRGCCANMKIKSLPRSNHLKSHPGRPVRISAQNGTQAIKCLIEIQGADGKWLNREQLKQLIESLSK